MPRSMIAERGNGSYLWRAATNDREKYYPRKTVRAAVAVVAVGVLHLLIAPFDRLQTVKRSSGRDCRLTRAVLSSGLRSDIGNGHIGIKFKIIATFQHFSRRTTLRPTLRPRLRTRAQVRRLGTLARARWGTNRASSFICMQHGEY